MATCRRLLKGSHLPTGASGVRRLGEALYASPSTAMELNPAVTPTITPAPSTHDIPTAADTAFHTDAAATKTIADLPGPPGWPVIGNFLTYIRKENRGKMHEVQAKYHAKFGGMFREKWGPKWQVHVSDPALLEQVYRHQGRYPRRPAIQAWVLYRHVTGRSLGVGLADGEEWHRVRSLLGKKVLCPSALGSFVQPFNEVTDDLIGVMRRTRDKEGEDKLMTTLSSLTMRWGLECASTILFDERLGYLKDEVPDEAKRLVEGFIDVSESSLSVMVGEKLHHRLNSRYWRRHKQAWDSIFGISDSIISRKVKEVKSRIEAGETIEQQKNMLSYFLASEELSIDDLQASVTEMMQGAMDTSANSMGFLLHDIACHPRVQQVARQEVDSVLEGRPLVLADLARLPYLTAVIKESMRLKPTVTMGVRVIDEDINLGGYKIPKDTLFVLNHFASSRDEASFGRAEEFLPERWLRDSDPRALSLKHSPFSSQPFGFGVRSCLGRRMANTMMVMALSKVLQNFEVEKCSEVEMKPVCRIFLSPGDRVPIRLRDR